MKRALTAVDRSLKLMYLLFLFWGIYWLISGLQKFVDPDAAQKGDLLDFTQFLQLPSGVGLGINYLVGGLEFLIGCAFVVLLFMSNSEVRRTRQGSQLFADRTMHRLVFKASILNFILFVPADITLGASDRAFEHTVYLLLLLVTYDLWYRTDRFVQAEAGEETLRGDVSQGSAL